MNNQYLKLGLAALMASIYSSAVSADVVDGDATANVIAPLLLDEVTPMNFGDVAGGTLAGTVTLPIGGGPRTITGDANALASDAGALGAFTIQGAVGLAYTLSITGTATLARAGAPGDTMTADTFSENAGALSGGLDAFQIGGTLNLGASQPTGAYSTGNPGGATFTVTANYN